MKKLNKKGFTLIELIVVIAILAILAAILIPAITGYISKATDSKNEANCRALYSQTAMEVMLDQTPTIGTSPATASGMTITYTADTTENNVSAFACAIGTTWSKTIK
ncbi:MAG: hypothetical protein FD179_1026 [Erysipelotrichaceae bacterium]|nr:MAG: hypothetical protein FD179_1026 [Erysipelotrichaceae bacterium]